jgi:hypothetical protein
MKHCKHVAMLKLFGEQEVEKARSLSAYKELSVHAFDVSTW